MHAIENLLKSNSDFPSTSIWFSAKLWAINRICKLSEHRAAAFQGRNQSKSTGKNEINNIVQDFFLSGLANLDLGNHGELFFISVK